MKPRYLKKKKIFGVQWVIAAVVVLLICTVSVILIKNDGADTVQTEVQETENPTTCATEAASELIVQSASEETEMIEVVPAGQLDFLHGQIQTPYLTLHYPESFEDYLLVINSCISPYTLEFYAVLPDKPEQRIFDLYMGDGSDGNLGVVVTDAGEIPIGMTVYSLALNETWSEGERDTVFAMQEAANELISNLNISYSQEGEQSPVLGNSEQNTKIVQYLRIETPYCDLEYPAFYADKLYLEETESEDVYSVAFYCDLEDREPILMFTVLFGGDEGEQLGIVTSANGITVPLNILMNMPSEEGLENEELDILYSMQEAVNQLVQRLPLQ